MAPEKEKPNDVARHRAVALEVDLANAVAKVQRKAVLSWTMCLSIPPRRL